MRRGYASNREFADRFIPAIRQIVGPFLLEPAPFEEDVCRATDLIILKARDLRIACRMRENDYLARWPWDFTIRCRLDNGHETEMSKMVDGFGDWFFYGFAAQAGNAIVRWMIVDLAAWRAHLIRKDWQEFGVQRSNGDGTHFIAFDVRKFTAKPKLLVACSFQPVAPVIQPHPSPPMNGHEFEWPSALRQADLFGDASP